jgi:hypothetical protein
MSKIKSAEKSAKSIHNAISLARRDEQVAMLAAAVPRQPTLVEQVDGFLAQTGMHETTFGRLAAGDDKLIHRLRLGYPRPGDRDKIRGLLFDAQRNLK